MARDRRNTESWNHATSFQDVAAIIASERCVEVLWAVMRRARSVKALAGDLSLAVSSISHCLGVLTQAGLVTFDGHDRLRDYRVTERATLRERDGRVELALRSSEGTELVVALSANLIAQLSREDNVAPVGALSGGTSPVVTVQPVVVPAPPGSVPTGLRPANAPG